MPRLVVGLWQSPTAGRTCDEGVVRLVHREPPLLLVVPIPVRLLLAGTPLSLERGVGLHAIISQGT